MDHIIQYVYRLAIQKFKEPGVSVSKKNKKTPSQVELTVYQPNSRLVLGEDIVIVGNLVSIVITDRLAGRTDKRTIKKNM